MSLFATPRVQADLVVNAALPITSRLQIQMIQVCDAAGNCATMFGTASEQAQILEGINTIWAQSGILVELLPSVMTWSDNMAYSSSSNLGQVTGRGPKNSDSAVMNLYFVAKSPCHSTLSANSSAGCAWIDGNGIALYVGSNLLGWSGGRELIASVAAHEIGHNLGLNHVGSGTANLMAPSGTTDQITATQTSLVFTNNGGVDGYDFLQDFSSITNFDVWKSANMIEGDADDDDDQDGITNGTEFVLGLSGQPGAMEFPLPKSLPGSGNLQWAVPVNPLALEDGFQVTFEGSHDLTKWFEIDSALANQYIALTESGGVTTITISNTQRIYLRLRVVSPVS